MTVSVTPPHLSAAERQALGRRARDRAPLEAQAGWHPPPGRPDPVSLLEAQNATRDPDLVPVRHGRMMASAFTFYRGSAAIMAADLATRRTAGLDVQLCGDAHLSNFGVYASPERQLLFDLNDFDETLPGPFEFDVWRLAASFVIAARHNQFEPSDVREICRTVGRSYREAMTEFAQQDTLDVWYARLSEAELRHAMKRARRSFVALDKDTKGHERPSAKHEGPSIKAGEAFLRKAHRRTNLQALAKLTEVVDGKQRIVSQPPVLIPRRELEKYYELDAADIEDVITQFFARYKVTLSDSRRRLLDRYTIVDVARKVVGVGSVGTRAFVALLEGRDEKDPLFLQVKEATRSVLEAHLPRSAYADSGQRVVEGQHLLQSASDIFLGWSAGIETDRYYYWRQLRDMKGAAVVEAMIPAGMTFYAQICGWTLARAHARTGDPIAIAAYLGSKRRFDKAVAEFAERYAVQNDHDYEAFLDAISSGRIDAREGV
ncbi:DUF2252 domain-containing protein [Terracoccus sp. 273MFTsu3.1]|uniref:DUF2252 domain-containing protein n=1 Tax=Terracoccus sp. 273MFTsu3.1 TaxID=1172188 RepID=UPI00039D3C97|nr:DUF2252 domain-containing protein [Terracoccus sp. 273MFTsu3.1]